MPRAYTKDERRAMRKVFQEHYAAGKPVTELATSLTAAGIARQDGQPWNTPTANMQALRLGFRVRSKRRQRRPQAEPRGAASAGPRPSRAQLKRPPACPDTALAILTDPKLDCEKKVAMLTAYYQ
jgi:hypothetical protein